MSRSTLSKSTRSAASSPSMPPSRPLRALRARRGRCRPMRSPPCGQQLTRLMSPRTCAPLLPPTPRPPRGAPTPSPLLASASSSPRGLTASSRPVSGRHRGGCSRISPRQSWATKLTRVEYRPQSATGGAPVTPSLPSPSPPPPIALRAPRRAAAGCGPRMESSV